MATKARPNRVFNAERFNTLELLERAAPDQMTPEEVEELNRMREATQGARKPPALSPFGPSRQRVEPPTTPIFPFIADPSDPLASLPDLRGADGEGLLTRLALGLGGFAAGFPIAGPAGGAVGATIGEEMISPLIQQARGRQVRPRGIPEVAQDSLITFLSNLLGVKGTGNIAKRTGQRLSEPFIKLTPEGQEAAQVVKETERRLTKKAGGTPSDVPRTTVPIGTATRSNFLEIFTNITNSAFFSSGIARKELFEVEDLLVQGIRDAATKQGGQLTKESAGRLIQESLTNSRSVAKASAKGLLKEIQPGVLDSEVFGVPQKLAKDLGIAVKPISLRRAFSLATNQKLPKAARDKLRRFIEKEIVRQQSRTAIEIDPATRSLFSGAVDLVEKNASRLRNKFIAGLADARPQAVADQVFKVNNPQGIRQVRDILFSVPGGKQRFSEIRERFLSDLAFQSRANITPGAPRVISGDSLLTKIEKLERSGALQAMFPGASIQEANRFKKLARALRTVQAGTTAREGSIFIQMKQPGAVVQLMGLAFGAGGGFVTGSPLASSIVSGLIILGPRAFTKLITNKKVNNFLIRGIREDNILKDEFITGLMGLLVEEGLEVRKVGEDVFNRVFENEQEEVAQAPRPDSVNLPPGRSLNDIARGGSLNLRALQDSIARTRR